MKHLKNVFVASLFVAIMFSFFSCMDLMTDYKLEVGFKATGDESSASRTVTMSATSDKYEDYEVYIVYTIDGTEPEITLDQEAYDEAAKNNDEVNIGEYVDYGSAILYTDPVSFSNSVYIMATAFYIKNNKVYKGVVSDYELNVASSQQSDVQDTGTVSGNFEFKLASTGNTNTTHYFDTASTNVFKWGEYEHCYYQIQFTIKSKGSGKWYLYVRQLGASKPLQNSNGDTAFVGQGTYEGKCFDDYITGNVASGNITLKNTVSDKEYNGTASIITMDETSYFSLKVNGTYGTAISVGDEK